MLTGCFTIKVFILATILNLVLVLRQNAYYSHILVILIPHSFSWGKKKKRKCFLAIFSHKKIQFILIIFYQNVLSLIQLGEHGHCKLEFSVSTHKQNPNIHFPHSFIIKDLFSACHRLVFIMKIGLLTFFVTVLSMKLTL